MSFLTKLKKLNFRSIFLNFYLFPLEQAIHLPLLIAKKVRISEIYRGGVQVNSKKLFPAMIQIGYSDVGTIDMKTTNSILKICKNGKLIFNGKNYIGAGCNISIESNGVLSFGKNVRCTGKSSFIASKKICIEDNCLISWDCIFMDTDFHKIILNEILANKPSEIKIHSNSWIGCRCTILKGAELPTNSVLGACSLLNKQFEEMNCLYAGNPARIVKKNIKWEE